MLFVVNSEDMNLEKIGESFRTITKYLIDLGKLKLDFVFCSTDLLTLEVFKNISV